MKIENDKFYTKQTVAKECINLINLSLYDLIIEPSAGNGAFSKHIKCVAYDIEPEDSSIIKQDFLLIDKPQCQNLLIIGNPPFGKRSALAKEFIKKSISIGAKTIAFILPDTFNKITMQKVFPRDWKLIMVHKITDTCFETKYSDYHVPCSFFIWSTIIDGDDLREKEVPQCSDFSFLKRGDMTADFVINGNSGKIKDVSEIKNPKSEHYIKASDDVRKIFEKIKWDFNSSVNGGISWLSQQDIIKKYIETKKMFLTPTV